ncbi:MAG: excinuclease ABC subunit UvrC [Microbacteriaceae bacterium]|nr:excinuclease ABC subunit UvrC [Microbacteriaceae bacterium]
MAEDLPWRPRTGEIPQKPGVYRFRDERGRILYVGKAKSLRNRLSNYFAPLSTLHDRTKRMVLTARSVEWTVVNSDFEALQLEWTWIKEFDPPFNVQYRDDKSYPYVAITLADDVPRILVTRARGIKGARYFGPYSRAWAIRDTVDTLLKAFPMRSCSDGVYARAKRSGRPCLLGDIGKCAAPCVGRVSPAEHKAIAVDLASFLDGGDQRFVRDIRRRMGEAAEAQQYEQAARFRDQLQAMQWALERNAVVLAEDLDADFFGVADDELSAAVQQFTVRGGRIRGVRAWTVDKELDVPLPELVESILETAYTDAPPPRLVHVPVLPADPAPMSQWLATRRAEAGERATKVELAVARRGEKAALAKTAAENAGEALVLYKLRRSGDFTARSNALAALQDALGLDEAPLRIECFDVSHLGGTNIVASMVVFEDGLPRKDQYRKFAIEQAADDTDAVHQVLSRRLARISEDEPESTEEREPAADGTGASGRPRKRFAYRPNLLLIDGGQPQVAAAARALAEAGPAAAGIAVVGIAKRLEELWLPGADFPVILPRNSDALFLVQRLRDEAHRFAIGYQRAKRRRDIGSVLAEVPGVGPARVKELLRAFGSAKAVKAATAEQLAGVRGIGATTAAAIVAALRSEAAAAESPRRPDGDTPDR